MTYFYLDTTGNPGGGVIRQILTVNADGSVTSFPDVEANEGPERAAYLAWLADGNSPLPWPPVS